MEINSNIITFTCKYSKSKPEQKLSYQKESSGYVRTTQSEWSASVRFRTTEKKEFSFNLVNSDESEITKDFTSSSDEGSYEAESSLKDKMNQFINAGIEMLKTAAGKTGLPITILNENIQIRAKSVVYLVYFLRIASESTHEYYFETLMKNSLARVLKGIITVPSDEAERKLYNQEMEFFDAAKKAEEKKKETDDIKHLKYLEKKRKRLGI